MSTYTVIDNFDTLKLSLSLTFFNGQFFSPARGRKTKVVSKNY